MVAVLNYGCGNIASIQRVISYLGYESVTVERPGQLRSARKVILPGVGNFDYGMSALKSRGLDNYLMEASTKEDVQMLGICLGMQLLCRSSEEGIMPGLGLVNADVKKIQIQKGSDYKIPHMGWNYVSVTRNNQLISQQDERQKFYFVHSYKVVPDSDQITIAKTEYSGAICAAFQVRNLYGVQFHPEKSHKFGVSLIRNFLEI